ncbi:tigger transposable element-derived protein 4-like [Mytilus californianus]|uniref:tigger transposable element-derived protein 4-like n=1 Tax=Mytilus californianus TaxID=6549 RepID=UPI0022465D34|nr:tigger transposable element-derived protein 4-like [Mytilus californianus]
MSIAKRKRNDLSLGDKFEVVKLLDKGQKQTEICKLLNISQAQVSRIKGKKDEICKSIETNSNTKRKRVVSGKDAEVEKALLEWFKNARERDIPLSGQILQEKAKELATQLGKDDFVATNGWLERWKGRNNIVYKKCHGEKKDADTEAADDWVTNVLPEILMNYNPDDIYNADETGLYYRAIPDGTLTEKFHDVAGSKKSKDRITVMVAANMTDTDKRPLLVIGKSQQPRCFRGVQHLPVTYKANKNAWMTSEYFKEWIKAFNNDMQRQRRHVILLVDNCSAHPESAGAGLQHVVLKFLPPNTTSIIQPCDQGIIRNLKAYYRSNMVRKVIRIIEASEVKLTANALARKLTLLDAVHLLKKSWSCVTTLTIINCFKKGGFVVPDHNLQEEQSEDDTTTLT